MKLSLSLYFYLEREPLYLFLYSSFLTSSYSCIFTIQWIEISIGWMSRGRVSNFGIKHSTTEPILQLRMSLMLAATILLKISSSLL